MKLNYRRIDKMTLSLLHHLHFFSLPQVLYNLHNEVIWLIPLKFAQLYFTVLHIFLLASVCSAVFFVLFFCCFFSLFGFLVLWALGGMNSLL